MTPPAGCRAVHVLQVRPNQKVPRQKKGSSRFSGKSGGLYPGRGSVWVPSGIAQAFPGRSRFWHPCQKGSRKAPTQLRFEVAGPFRVPTTMNQGGQLPRLEISVGAALAAILSGVIFFVTKVAPTQRAYAAQGAPRLQRDFPPKRDEPKKRLPSPSRSRTRPARCNSRAETPTTGLITRRARQRRCASDPALPIQWPGVGGCSGPTLSEP